MTQPLAVEAAKLRYAKKWGLGEALVYATARAADARLLTGDPDFAGVEAVESIGPGHTKN